MKENDQIIPVHIRINNTDDSFYSLLKVDDRTRKYSWNHFNTNGGTVNKLALLLAGENSLKPTELKIRQEMPEYVPSVVYTAEESMPRFKQEITELTDEEFENFLDTLDRKLLE